MEMLEEIDAVFKSGQSLLIFPEGTRTGWDGQVKMHRGAVSLGLRSASVITPVCIKMTPPNFKKGQPWYKIPPQKIIMKLPSATTSCLKNGWQKNPCPSPQGV